MPTLTLPTAEPSLEIEALTSSAQDFQRALLENLPQRVFFKDRHSTFVCVNAAFAADYNFTPEALTGKSDFDLFPAEHAEKYRADDLRVMQSGRTETTEEVNIMDGVQRIVEVTKTPVFNAQGEIIGLIGLFTDITARKQAEESLKESEERYRNLFNQISDSIFIFDAETLHFLDCNERVQKIYGYSLEELRAMTPFDLHPPEEVEDVKAKVRLRKSSLPFIYTHLTKDHRRIAVEILSDEIEYRGRRAFISIARDVTERKRAELERQINLEIVQALNTTANLDEFLRSVHQALGKLLAAENCFIALYDSHSEMLHMQYFVDQFDPLPPPQKLGRGLTAYVFHSGTPVLMTEEVFAELVKAGEVEDIGTKPASWMGVPFKTPGELSGVVVVQHYTDAQAYSPRDLEFLNSVGGQIALAIERKSAEEKLKTFAVRLETSNRELQEFASVASHDLQEPLRKIQAFGDRLKSKCGPALDESGRDYLDRMQNAAQRMQTLINDLLTFSRVTTQTQPFVPVSIAGVVRDVLSDLEIRLEQTNAQVTIGKLMTIEADALQLRQLLQNLIGNALKFTRPGVRPQLTIEADRLFAPDEHSAGQVREICQLSISDNGIGFDEKYLDRIFNVFQRLHGRQEYEGTGVGLAVCRRIAERHGGSITAHSRPGEGSTFIVSLPVTHPKGEGF